MSNSLVTQWTQNGLLFLPPGDIPDPGIKPKSPVLAGGFFNTALIRRPDHLRPCTQLNLVTNPILLQLCRGNKNTRLLLPWSLAYIPSRRYNLSLLTSRGLKVFPFNFAHIESHSYSSITLSLCLYFKYFSLAFVHREPRFCHQYNLWVLIQPRPLTCWFRGTSFNTYWWL